MSTLIVEVCKIEEVHPHGNADRLEIVKVKGWYCVTGKGSYNVDDLCVYIPIDSVLPQELEEQIFGIDSKIKLEKSRVRTIKIRGVISQGLIVKPELVGVESYPLGADVKDVLNIKKFEPEENSRSSVTGSKNPTPKKYTNPYFTKYTDIENIKNFPNVFTPGEQVYVSEKLHGTSFRCGWFPTEANTWFKRVKKFFGLLPKYEFCYGSRNVQLQEKLTYSGYYATNLYYKIVKEYNLKSKLSYGEAVYGEIVGPGIQIGYHYGIPQGEHEFYAYDIKKDGQYLNYLDFRTFCSSHDIPTVPELLIGLYDYELIKSLIEGPSTLTTVQSVREGVVIKPLRESNTPHVGRKVLKFISDAFLENKNNSDFH